MAWPRPAATLLNSGLDAFLAGLPLAGWPLGIVVAAAGALAALALLESLQVLGRAAEASRYRFDGVLDRFAEEGIEVPYPHVDVGFRDDPPRGEAP